MQPNILTSQQLEIIKLLAQGKTYHDCAQVLGKTVYTVHTQTRNIRLITGITDTRDPQQCRDWIRTRKPVTIVPTGLSPRQLEAMRLVVDGRSRRQIGERMGLQEQTVNNLVSAAYSRLQIPRSHSAAYRRVLLRQSLASIDAILGQQSLPSADPMDDPAFH